MEGKTAEKRSYKSSARTIVYDFETGEKIGEVTFHGQELIVARGGRGGRGNMAFATSKNPNPA